MDFDVDVLIAGAGVAGLSAACALARRGKSVIVVEREARIGQGVSSRNSEVIHAGIHYPPGSLKARLCLEGRRALYDFLPAHGVAFDKCEKLIVATEESEVLGVEGLHQRGVENGVEGMRMLSAAEAKALEPELHCAAALLSSESGIMDAHGFLLALQGEIESAGGAIALNAPFEGATPLAEGFAIRIGGESPMSLNARQLVIAAGLGAQVCARSIEGFPAAHIPPLHFGKGNYFALSGRAPFKRLIYPPPIPGALGIHYKRDLGGRAHFGPDLEYVEHEDYRVNEGRIGFFYDTVRRFWPALPDGALSPDYAGIRPKLHGAGEPQDDFVLMGSSVHGLPGLVAHFGIESPGLTASLAIGEETARMLESET
ncbi:MAG: NAD(P)/FAD-dependent oxidoreductase [Hyphomonadaceae bacterium]